MGAQKFGAEYTTIQHSLLHRLGDVFSWKDFIWTSSIFKWRYFNDSIPIGFGVNQFNTCINPTHPSYENFIIARTDSVISCGESKIWNLKFRRVKLTYILKNKENKIICPSGPVQITVRLLNAVLRGPPNPSTCTAGSFHGAIEEHRWMTFFVKS